MNTKILDISIWRGDCSGGKFEGFQVPHQDSQTILDGVVWIQQNIDPSLAYRYACRVGMDGCVRDDGQWAAAMDLPNAVSATRVYLDASLFLEPPAAGLCAFAIGVSTGRSERQRPDMSQLLFSGEEHGSLFGEAYEQGRRQ